MKHLLISFIFILISGFSTAQTTIHVSANSVQAGNGTLETPFNNLEEAFKQLDKLAEKAKSQDTIYISIQPGLYFLENAIKLEKEYAVPVVIEGDKEHKPIISGAIKLSEWEITPKGWWKTHVKEVERYGLKIEQLFVNGERATRARTPDEGWFFVEDSKESVHFKGTWTYPEYATQQIQVRPEDLQTMKNTNIEDITDIMAMFYHKWTDTRINLSYARPDSGYLFIQGNGMRSWNPITKGSRFILENYKGALNAKGEWYINKSGDLYYIPQDGESIETATVYAPVLNQLLTIKGKKGRPVKNIQFRNLSFEHTNYTITKKWRPITQAASFVNAAIQLDYAENIHFENCQIQHIGNYGFSFNEACKDCTVKHSYLYDLGAGGIKIGETNSPSSTEQLTRQITVENNIIQRAGRIFPSAVGVVIFHSSDNRVIHNEIFDQLYTGISVGWVWGFAKSYSINNEIAYNHIHHIGWGELCDMGGIYTLGISPGTRVHHNVIHHIFSFNYGAWGLYTDEGSSHIVMENNLVYGCRDGGFHQHYGEHNLIRNNIFAYSQHRQIYLTKRKDKKQSLEFTSNIVLIDKGALLYGPFDTTSVKMDKNCYWSLRTDSVSKLLSYSFKDWKKFKEPNSIMQNPGFVDQSALDFRFKNQKAIKKIGFIPFDYTKAGVYGDKVWKEKARMPKEREEAFNRVVRTVEENPSSLFFK